MFKISEEKEILSQDLRKNFIKYYRESEQTKERIKESLRRYEIYHDKTSKYVLERLKKEMADSEEVAHEMKNRASNVSIARVITDKKARVFGDGTRFEVAKKKDQKIIDELFREVGLVGALKKANKFTELQKNCAFQVYPYKNQSGLYDIKTRILQPFAYDVLVDKQDEEVALCYVLPTSYENGEPKEYIWWSKNYHLTTDENGVAKPSSPSGFINELGELPIIQFSMDNTNVFWSEGGQDVIDGSILFNMLLTDTYYITKYQGMGIFYMFGKGIPKNMKVGPRDGIMLEQEAGDPTPSIGFATSNPPIEAQMRLAEQCAMLILSSNEIDTSSIAGSLTNGAASGFQEAIRKSEFVGDIEEKRELYRESVREVLNVVLKMFDLYNERKLLTEKYEFISGKKIGDLKPVVKFPKTQIYTSEKEKLEVIEKRLNLGLDDEIDAMMRDNNDLSREEALNILKERKMRELEDSITEKQEEIKEEIEEDID